MQLPPWKEAASLIIVARATVSEKVGRNLANTLVVSSRVSENHQHPRNTNSSKCDYRIMMVKRSGLSSFMASAFVFPGGQVEVADYSPKWWQVFQNLGIAKHDLDVLTTSVQGPRPPMVTNPVTLTKAEISPETTEVLPADIALRIAAIRETFEETGVLLLTHPSSKNESDMSTSTTPLVPLSDMDDVPVDLGVWRERVRNDASSFISLCLEAGLCPDLWSLYEWWDWLTPISVGHKRYDTIFYLCCLEKQPKVVLDNTEVTTLKWCTPPDMLEEHSQEKIFLAPPQVYELSRIHNLSNFNSVQDFASKRQTFGIERWLPVISTYSDGALSVLPGDDDYPAEPDIIGRKPLPDYPQSLEEIRSGISKLNRIELRGPTCITYCNMKLSCGHLSPLTYPPTSAVVQSML